MKQLGHANRQNLVEEVLTLMAREKHNQEVLPLPRLHLYLYWLILMPSTSLPLVCFLLNSMPCQWIRKPILNFKNLYKVSVCIFLCVCQSVKIVLVHNARALQQYGCPLLCVRVCVCVCAWMDEM